MTDKPTRLGPFEIGECIGQGGMGKVFRGVHATTRQPVAVKVILGQADSVSRGDFHREVQAHAGLAHPGVVYLFDYGTVEEGVLGLEPGSPYVAMELAEQGTVHDLMLFWDWESVRQVLLQVLDALAFAHARRVIHRDLKPENFLVFMNDDGERRIKLADFGLAHAFRHGFERTDESLAQVSGTPYYMAPEQFRGAWRTYGPWTDIYALGCIAWHLVCGRPPYVAPAFFALAMKHCSGEVPALEPLFPIPDGVEAWIRTAMALEPRRRFQWAADAAQALEESSPSAKLVLPARWQAAQEEPLPSQLVGTGLGLFGLREVPFVDRDGARDRIWSALQDVTESRDLRVVFVGGDAGVGKSRLVQWMATRAHEVGAAEVLRAVHTRAGSGPTEGLAGLVQRAFHTWKLSRKDLYKELLQRLAPLDEEDSFRQIDARALTELVHPAEENTSDVEGPRYHFSSSRQKYALMSRLLTRFARDRAPVLWLDDLQYSSEGLGLLEYLLSLSDEERPAVLILATIRADVMAENTELARQVATFVDHALCQRIDLEAIDASDHRELIDLILPLSPDLAHALATRTEGNPLFAHQLLSHWIVTASVETSAEGFRAVAGKTLSLPDDIHSLWEKRLDRLLKLYPAVEREQAEDVIELAAALGREVDRGEWLTLCAEAGRTVPAGLDNALIERGLAERTEDGWAFSHGLLVDSIERRARQRGHWPGHHRRCALMLATRYPEHQGQTGRRRAGHWIEAGELGLALGPLLEASTWAHELGDTAQWKQSLKLHRELLDRLGLDRHAPQRLGNDLLASEVLFFEGKTEDGIAGVEDVLRVCPLLSDDVLTLRAHEVLARFLTKTGQFERAQQEIQTALDLTRTTGDDHWQGKLVQRQAEAWFHLGELEKAELCNRRAREHFGQSTSTYEALLSEVFRGWVQLSKEEYREGHETFQAVLRAATKQGFRGVESYCLNGLGEIARFSKELIQARVYYQQSLQIELEMGDAHAQQSMLLMLAQVELALGHFDRGRRLLERGQSQSSEFTTGRYREFLDCMEILLACGIGEWPRARRTIDKYNGGWPENRPAWKDHVWLLELAAGHAEGAAQSACARKLWRLAGELWRKLGREAAAERAEDRMMAL